MVCKTKDLYKSVRRCPGVRITPGVRASILFILKSQILTWPKLPTTLSEKDTDMSSLATYKENFVLESDAKWKRLDLVALKSNISSETQGEAPSATILNKGEFIVGGTDADVSGLGSMIINDPVVIAVQEPDGRFRILGCEAYDPKVTFAQSSGTSATDAKTSTVSVEATDFCPAPYYEGKLETEDGDINGATGAVWVDAVAHTE